MNRFQTILLHLEHQSNPPYGLATSSLTKIVNEVMIDNRIASEDGSYPFSEALFGDIEEWEQVMGEDFETIVRESMA